MEREAEHVKCSGARAVLHGQRPQWVVPEWPGGWVRTGLGLPWPFSGGFDRVQQRLTLLITH